MATSQIQKQRIETNYRVYMKRYPMDNVSNKPPIEIDKDSFFSKGVRLDVYITAVKNIYTDWYDYTLTNVDNNVVESISEKPIKTDKEVVLVDTRIETEKVDWDMFEVDTFERAILYFKNEFDSRKFDNKVSLNLTLDQSIEGQYISEDVIEWIFNKFLNSVNLTSFNINTNAIILPNSQYNNLSITISGFDVSVKNLCYFVTEGSINLSHLRLIHQSDNANESSEITFEAYNVSINNIEIHGLLKLNVNGIIDTEDNYSASSCIVNSIRYYIKDLEESSLNKRNIFKISNFNEVVVNSLIVPKNYPNSTFLHIARCTTVSITNYTNTNITSSKSGSEIFCESVRELNVSDVNITSKVENDNYYFISATKCIEGSDINVSDCNFVNIGILDLLGESFGDVRISDVNIVSNKPINTMGISIYNLDFDDVNLNCKEFKVEGIVTLSLSDVNFIISKDFNVKSEKLVIDDCLFNISGDFIAYLDADASTTASQSRIVDTGIECKGFKVESQEGFNKTLKYDELKIYASSYEDLNIDKLIISGKTIIESITYGFNSIKMLSYTEEFYIRIASLKQSEEAIIMKAVFSGKLTFDLEGANGIKNIYLKMIGNSEETIDVVSSTIIFDGMDNVVDSKNFHLISDNAYLDMILKTINVNLLNIGLSIEGDKSFENCRVFYQGSNKTIFKFEKIDASKLENTEYLELNTLPTKNKYKFQYGRIEE